MVANATEQSVPTIDIRKETVINAPIEIAFEALLEEVGPGSEMPDGKPFPFKLEAWPGGRWYRDLGGNAGHFWGHVQVIKPPTLLEICGPLFMSYPALNHLQYRLTAEGDGGTRLTFTHRATGLIPPDVQENVGKGWGYRMQRFREIAERLMTSRKEAR